MGENSKIEWTDHTFNPWIGCAKVAPGCTHCYAETFAKRTGKAKWGLEGTRVRTSPKYWREPLKWDRAAECFGTFDCANGSHSDACPQAHRPRVFCASMADVFEDWRGGVMVKVDGGWVMLANAPSLPSAMDEARADLFTLIDATPNLDWLLLTKRPENIRRMWPVWHKFALTRRANVWLGTSISEQESADKNLPELLRCRDLARVLFVSAEPLLGPIDLKPRPPELRGACLLAHPHFGPCQRHGLDWVIVGGESGHRARPMHPDWARQLRDQCQSAGVPFFFKQWGEWAPAAMPYEACHRWDDGTSVRRVGKKAAGRLLDGRAWNEFPSAISASSAFQKENAEGAEDAEKRKPT